MAYDRAEQLSHVTVAVAQFSAVAEQISTCRSDTEPHDYP